jgi:hypothetical protein
LTVEVGPVTGLEVRLPAKSSLLAKRAVARSQASLRILNARIELQFEAVRLQPLGAEEELLIRCECGVDACDAVLAVRQGELRAARVDARRFLVAPGHGVDGVEHLVLRAGCFDLVEADGEAARVAEELALRNLRV